MLQNLFADIHERICVCRTAYVKHALQCVKGHAVTAYTFFLLNKLKIYTVKILKFGTPPTIAIIALKIEKFAVTLH